MTQALPGSSPAVEERTSPDIQLHHAELTANDGLSYLATSGRKRRLVSDDDRASLSYVPVAGVALVLGAPAGQRTSVPNLADKFLAVCGAEKLRPVLLGVPRWVAEDLESRGFRSLSVGDEAVTNLEDVHLRGRVWRDVRLALNRAERKDVIFEWVAAKQRTPLLLAELRSVSRAWLARRLLPELHFAFGDMQQTTDPSVRLGVARSAEGRIEGFVTWVPAAGQGGWMLDLLRGRPGSMNNRLSEFLVGSSMLAFRREGSRLASLGGTPLAHVDRRQWPGGRWVFSPLAALARPLYDFEGLRRFKRKFNPTWHPLYLSYRGRFGLAAALTAVALACTTSMVT